MIYVQGNCVSFVCTDWCIVCRIENSKGVDRGLIKKMQNPKFSNSGSYGRNIGPKPRAELKSCHVNDHNCESMIEVNIIM